MRFAAMLGAIAVASTAAEQLPIENSAEVLDSLVEDESDLSVKKIYRKINGRIISTTCEYTSFYYTPWVCSGPMTRKSISRVIPQSQVTGVKEIVTTEVLPRCTRRRQTRI